MLEKNRNWVFVFFEAGALFFTLLGAIGYFLLLRYPYHINYVQERTFTRISMLTLAFFIGGVLCGILSFCFYQASPNSLAKRAFFGCIFVSSIGLGALFSTPRLAVKSVLSATNICINTARKIEAAKAEWAQTQRAADGTKLTGMTLLPISQMACRNVQKGGITQLAKSVNRSRVQIPSTNFRAALRRYEA